LFISEDEPDGLVNVNEYVAITPGVLMKEEWVEVFDLVKAGKVLPDE
jgi:hypothetical protein